MTRASRRLGAIALATAAFVSVASPAPTLAQDATLDRARAAIESGQAATARPALESYARANPGSAPGFYWLGRAHMAERSWEKAADALERAVRLDPAHAPSHFYLGAAYGEQAQRASKLRQPFLAKKVQREFERAVELDADYLDAREGLVDFYRMAPGFMGGSIDKAKAQASEIRKRNALRGAYAFAEIAMHEKKPEVAMKELDNAIAAAPDSAGPYVQLADMHGRAGDWARAWEVVGRFQARRPDDPRGGYFTGRFAAMSGQRLDDGERGLRQYLARAHAPGTPTHAAAHWRLGQIAERRGDKPTARREYEAALRLDPELAGAKESLQKLGA